VRCSPPEINSATARLPLSFQTPSLHCHTLDHRVLCRGNPGARLPLPWSQHRPPAKNTTHLPLDARPYSMLFLLGPDGHAPLPVTSQHLLGESYPSPPPGRTYPQLKLLSKKLLVEEWEVAAPGPERYAYRPSLKPHPFMALSKFDAGCLHQMRSGKSYLRAHPFWDDDGTTTCPSCNEAPQSFEHTILHCSAKEPARNRNLQGVTELGPDAPAWSSLAPLGALTRCIRSTATAFPPGMFPRRPSSAGSIYSRLSTVISVAYFMSSQER